MNEISRKLKSIKLKKEKRKEKKHDKKKRRTEIETSPPPHNKTFKRKQKRLTIGDDVQELDIIYNIHCLHIQKNCITSFVASQ